MREYILKEHFISKAYEIIKEEGTDGMSIRRIGDELGCNSANLYRYFTGMDELIVYASIQFLRDYLKEVAEYFKSITDSVEIHEKVWKCFTQHSFRNPEIFDNLFFGRYSERLDEIMHEYYELFPEEFGDMSQENKVIFVEGSFSYRDYLMLERCVKDEKISKLDAECINKTNIMLYKGFLKDILDQKRQGKNVEVESMTSQFMECLSRMISNYIRH